MELVIDQISNEYRVTDNFFIITNLKKMEEEFDIVFKIGSWISSLPTVIDSNASIIRSYNASLAS